MAQTKKSRTAASHKSSASSSASSGSRKKAGTRSGSGTRKKTTSSRSGSRSSSSGAGRRAAAMERARLEKEKREREIRMDIALVVVLVAMIFLYLSLFGLCGNVGTVLKEMLFGIFGIGSWGVPAWAAALCILLITGVGGSRMPVRMLSIAGLLLILETGGHLALHLQEVISLETRFDAEEAFRLCARMKAGGGILGGFFARSLYRLFGMSGSILVCITCVVIFLILLIQRSPASVLRSWQRERQEAGIPAFSERRAIYRQRRLEELAEEEEARLEKEAARILEREERKEARRRRADGDSINLEHTRLDKPRRSSGKKSAEPAGDDLYTEGSRRRRKGSSTAAARRDVHEIVLLPQEESQPLTISAGTGRRHSGLAAELPEAAGAVPFPGGKTYRRSGDFEEADAEKTRRADPALDVGRFTSFSELDASGRHGDPLEKTPGRISPQEVTYTGSGPDVIPMDPADPARAASSRDSSPADFTHKASSRVSGSADPARAASSRGQSPADPALDASAQSSGTGRPLTPVTGGKGEAASSYMPTEEDLNSIAVHRGDETGKPSGRSGHKTAVPRKNSYIPPAFSLLERGTGGRTEESERELRETAYRLQETLRTFGVQVTITDISQGPSVTRYELKPDQGVKVSKIVNLADDIKLRLAATDIRIEAPIPGKSAIGIEVPNKKETTVHLRELLESREFRRFDGKLPFTVGKDIGGKTVIADIARMPHLLIAGATGSGKSVCINTIILSILYRTSPEKVKLLMIDPKVVELSVYKKIPHLIIPVVTDARKASAALNWAVAEMEKRYKLFAAAGVRDLNGFNALASTYRKEDGELQYDPMPRLVIIVDELADLMMVSKNEVESAICRLAQLARAAGIHLIIATQRPSVDVITGLIKANMPSRIAFAVSSQVDSRTILDMGGAEKLIGRGDMLFAPQYYQKPARVQGAFVSDEEVTAVVDFIKKNNAPDTDYEEVNRQIEDIQEHGIPVENGSEVRSMPGRDEKFAEAGRFIIEKNKASIGLLQRVFKIGFNRAARIMDQLAEAGVVSEESSTRARQVLMSMPEFEAWLEENGS